MINDSNGKRFNKIHETHLNPCEVVNTSDSDTKLRLDGFLFQSSLKTETPIDCNNMLRTGQKLIFTASIHYRAFVPEDISNILVHTVHDVVGSIPVSTEAILEAVGASARHTIITFRASGVMVLPSFSLFM